jgi:hypothetical protein
MPRRKCPWCDEYCDCDDCYECECDDPYDPYEGEEDSTGRIRYYCPYCDACFDTPDALYVHLEGSPWEND